MIGRGLPFPRPIPQPISTPKNQAQSTRFSVAVVGWPLMFFGITPTYGYCSIPVRSISCLLFLP